MARVMCECGAVLLEDVTHRGVLPVGADQEIPFRRSTDHIACDSCLRVYPVGSFQRSNDPALPSSASAPDQDDEDLIARLERLAEESRTRPAE